MAAPFPGIHPVVSEVLRSRGLASAEEARSFIGAQAGDLVHPDRWPGVPEAAACIVEALGEGRVPAVWGDYDCDGVTASAILLEVFKAHGIRCLHHLPDRHVEGYGLNTTGIQGLRSSGAGLLITVDCGIAGVGEVALAKALGMRAVVTDHHLPDGPLPAADAVCDMHALPEGVQAPDRELCGAGLAFFVAAAVNRALAERDGIRFRMDGLLELAALGTLADSVPLLGQNRVLAKSGLARMRMTERPGLRELLRVAGLLDGPLPLGGMDAGFRLAPRINAAGRLGSAENALELLLTKDEAKAAMLAKELDRLNEQRKSIGAAIEAEAMEMAREMRGAAGLVLHGRNWHDGVIGICASRIAEAFGVPAMLFGGAGKRIKGSGRSVPGVDIHEALARCREWLEGFGGHAMAAGAGIQEAKLVGFARAFAQACEAVRIPVPEDNAARFPLDFREASGGPLARALEALEPFGEGNPQPVFRTMGAVDCMGVKPFGKKPDSGIVVLSDGSASVRAKVWGSIAEWSPGMRLDSADFTLARGFFNGAETVDITIVPSGPEPVPALAPRR